MSAYTFLLCTERSGSNLLTRIMNQHSQYCGPAPMHLFRILLNSIHRYGNLEVDSNWEILLNDVADVTNTKLGIWNSSFDYGSLSSNISERSINAILDYIHETEMVTEEKEFLFTKENNTYEYYDQLLELYPESKFVYMVRDPRDCILSWIKSPNHPGDIQSAAEFWVKEQQEYLEITRKAAYEHKAHLLLYEDLVEAVEPTLEILCDFLRVSFEPAMLEFYKNELTVKNSNRLTDWQLLSSEIQASNTNKFYQELNKEEIGTIESICGGTMTQFGYLPAESDLVKDEVNRTQKVLSEEEIQIRKDRIEVIERILSRNLT